MNERRITSRNAHVNRTAGLVGRRLRARSIAVVVAVAASLGATACGSDNAPDIENPSEPDVPIDVNVDDGVDTDVEQPGNLNFDVEQPGFDD